MEKKAPEASRITRLYHISTAMLLTACGIIPVGGGALNATAPSGTAIYQGTFTGNNSNSVSGTATVYEQSASGYALYLNGLSAPSQSSLVVILSGCNGTPVDAGLQGTSGSQVYNFTASCNTFSSVTIQSTSLNQSIGQALLYATGQSYNNNNNNNTN